MLLNKPQLTLALSPAICKAVQAQNSLKPRKTTPGPNKILGAVNKNTEGSGQKMNKYLNQYLISLDKKEENNQNSICECYQKDNQV